MRYAAISGIFVISSTAASFFSEPLFPLGDWRWLLVASTGVLIAWLLWFTDPKRRWQSFCVRHDGREIAKQILRIPKRHAGRAEAIYQAYTSLAPELKQFPEQAAYGYHTWLNMHWPDRAVEFVKENPDISMYDAYKQSARYAGVRYAPGPWWKRVWQRIRW